MRGGWRTRFSGVLRLTPFRASFPALSLTPLVARGRRGVCRVYRWLCVPLEQGDAVDEDIFLESRLFPWLDDDSMSDECGGYPPEENYFCEECGAGCEDAESVCWDCGNDPIAG